MRFRASCIHNATFVAILLVVVEIDTTPWQFLEDGIGLSRPKRSVDAVPLQSFILSNNFPWDSAIYIKTVDVGDKKVNRLHQ